MCMHICEGGLEARGLQSLTTCTRKSMTLNFLSCKQLYAHCIYMYCTCICRCIHVYIYIHIQEKNCMQSVHVTSAYMYMYNVHVC